MARIGNIRPQSRIYNLALGRYEDEFEMEEIGLKKQPFSGLTSRQRVSEDPLGPQKIIFGSYDAPQFTLQNTNMYSKKKLQKDDVPTTEYQKKIGIRSHSSFMQKAEDKPYIELGGSALNGDIFGSAPSTDLLTEQEKYELMTVYKPSMAKPKTKQEEIIEHVAKVGQPYLQEKLSRANTNPREFIENDLQKIELYPSEETNKGDGGSNLVFDYRKEFHKGTQPKTRKQLYDETFRSRKSTSNINTAQRTAQTARNVLGVYGNKQHEGGKQHEGQIPDIVPTRVEKNLEVEKKLEDDIEMKMDGYELVKTGAQIARTLLQ